MHHFHPLQFPGLDLGGTEAGDAAGEFGAVQVANPHHFPGRKLTIAPRDAGRQQALPPFAQCLFGARIHEQRALGMVKKGDPSLAALAAGSAAGTNKVPSSSPANTRASTRFFLPEAMTSGMPDRTAILAA